METYDEKDKKLKRTQEEMEAEKKEVLPDKRIKVLWEYVEEVKKLQELEIQVELVRKKLRLKELRFPDLKNLRGNVDHIIEDRFFEVDDDDKKRIVPGKSLAEASEKYFKKKAQDAKNAQAQKEKAKEKKGQQ